MQDSRFSYRANGVASKASSVSLWCHLFASHVLWLPPASCWFLAWLTLQPWRRRRHVPPKRPLTFKGRQGIMSQEDWAVHFRALLTRHWSLAWPTYTTQDSPEMHKYSSTSCSECNPRALRSCVPCVQLIPHGRSVRLVYIKEWVSKRIGSPLDESNWKVQYSWHQRKPFDAILS
jgi:hypothetical protein